MIHFETSKDYLEKCASYSGVERASAAAVTWIENVLQIRVPVNNGFRTSLASGEILCSLMNAIIPGSIKRINRNQNRASSADNLSLFLEACQTHCGIPKARLFDISDFEDTFERGNDSYSVGEKTEKNSERVVISIFWLAKFVGQDPRWAHFPKLDYEAFSDLLPWRIIQSTRQEPVETQPLPLTKNYSRFSTPVTMGNNGSSIVQDTHEISTNSPNHHEAVVQRQQNNNGTEDDDWESNLNAWRERRLRISLQQATTFASVEQLRQEEERQKQEAARDRLRQIILQHSSLYSPNIPCANIKQPVSPISPGLALLTGQAYNNADLQANADCGRLPTPVEALNELDLGDSNPKKEPPIEATSLPCDSDNPCVNGDSLLSPVSAVNFDEHDNRESIDHSDTDSENRITSSGGHREIQLRLQSKPNSTEIRWGLKLKALGRSNTAPFVVDHVKIGSTADVCDFNRGDILVRVNETNVSPSDPDSITLPLLEQLLDRLAHNGHVTNILVLRKRSDSLDGEESTGSSSVPTHVCNEQSSDVDEQSVGKTELTVSRNAFRAANSIHFVKPITHELIHISTAESKCSSRAPLESSLPQTSMPCETVTTDLRNETALAQASLAIQPRTELPVRSSVTTRI